MIFRNYCQFEEAQNRHSVYKINSLSLFCRSISLKLLQLYSRYHITKTLNLEIINCDKYSMTLSITLYILYKIIVN